MKDNKKKKSLDDLKEKDIKTLTPEEQKKLKGGDDEEGGSNGGMPIRFP